MSPEMQAELDRWSADKRAKEEQLRAKGKALGTFEELREQMRAAFEQLPEKVEIPFERTPEGERQAQFIRLLKDGAPEFLQKINRALLPNAAAFDRVALWDGRFPGPCAVGSTDTAKTRAAWSALGRLYVRENRAFAWFPARRLVTELDRYTTANVADEFFRAYDFFPILFVDDVDKINWQFESEKAALFAFFDWVYRKNKPCITTTNKPRAWWIERMGEAFARRLFESEVQF